MGEKPLIATGLSKENGYVYIAEYADIKGDVHKAYIFAKDLESAVNLFRACVPGYDNLLAVENSGAKLLIVQNNAE